MNKKTKIFIVIVFSSVFLFLLPSTAEAACYVFCSKFNTCDCGRGMHVGASSSVWQTTCIIGSDLWCGWPSTTTAVDQCANDANTRRCKGGACPDYSGWNGTFCKVSRACSGWTGCYGQDCEGKWDVSNRWCVGCSGKTKVKILGTNLGIGVNCGSCDGSALTSAVCESACGADAECDEKSYGSGVIASGGTCNNCVFTAETGGIPGGGIPGGSIPGGSIPGGGIPGIINFKNPLKDAETIPEIIAAIGDFIFFIGIGLVTLMVVIAGIIFMTAGGDPQKVSKAKTLLFWTVIGAGITIFSKGVSGIIKYLLGG